MSQNTNLISRRLPTTAVVGFALAFAACGEPTGLTAIDPTITSVITVYSLTGTPTGFPTAISLPGAQAVRADANLFFDVAFDMDESGLVSVYPMELIAWPRLDIHRVGILSLTEDFEDVVRAPQSGYTYDEVLQVREGAVIVVESNDPRVCFYPYPIRRYARLLLESVDVQARSIRVRMTNNANCGFRSFLPGVPAD